MAPTAEVYPTMDLSKSNTIVFDVTKDELYKVQILYFLKTKFNALYINLIS